MSEEMITLTKEEYDELRRDSDILNSLYAMGVDNWPGYDEAMDDYRSNRG